jgi:hypothetical protein
MCHPLIACGTQACLRLAAYPPRRWAIDDAAFFDID